MIIVGRSLFFFRQASLEMEDQLAKSILCSETYHARGKRRFFALGAWSVWASASSSEDDMGIGNKGGKRFKMTVVHSGLEASEY
jgi:hypothetical protein